MDKHRILVIDDDRDIIEVMSSFLSNEGFEIYSAETVEKGIEMINEVSPHIILLDIMFPKKETGGFIAANEIKEKYPELPVFAFSAINREYAFEFTKEDIKADEFINKPVKIGELVKLIRKYT